MQAHSKEILLPVEARYSSHASMTVARGYLRLSGTSWSRSKSLAACSDTARFTWSVLPASRRIPGTTPTVEMVRCLAARPRSRFIASTAVQTASKFASGSPIPMSTTLPSWPQPSNLQRLEAITTCSTISPELSCRPKPASPVAQKVQPIAQPAWLETHTVVRSRYRIRTVSMRLPSRVSSSHFNVEPLSATLSAAQRNADASAGASSSRSRSARGSMKARQPAAPRAHRVPGRSGSRTPAHVRPLHAPPSASGGCPAPPAGTSVT